MSEEAVDRTKQKILELIKLHSSHESLKTQKELADARKRITELEKQITAAPSIDPGIHERHQATVKVHSDRARAAIIDAEESRREVILLRRWATQLEGELKAANDKIIELSGELAEVDEAIKDDLPAPSDKATKLRRSRRGEVVPG